MDDAFGITPPPNGRIIRNLVQGSNYIQSHILHFFHLAALDYVKGPETAPFVPRYDNGDTYRLPKNVNDVVVGHYITALDMRRKAHEMGVVFGGKMPHTTVYTPGGVTDTPTPEKIELFKQYLAELTDFIINVYIPTALAVVDVYGDWLEIGAGCKNFLAYGVFPLTDRKDPKGGNQFLPRGAFINGKLQPMNADQIKEEVRYSWYANETGGLHPSEGRTIPEVDKKSGYSWVKSPRYDGYAMEVGPLARLVVARDPEIVKLGDKAYSVMGRHFARALECLYVAKAMAEWVDQMVIGEPAFLPYDVPKEGRGMGLTEAPRGALGHWIEIENYRIKNYQAVVPSTWNLCPRDAKGQLGPVEQALVGTEVIDPNNPVELVRIVRSFDPCLACAIHVLEVKGASKDLKQFRVV